jgi:very-short-patch-repair endonuclease
MEIPPPTVRERVSAAYAQTVMTRAELLARGMSPRAITSAVRSGALQRLRRDRYAAAGVDDDVAEAIRIGGRITCLSLLQSLGVFVMTRAALHVHLRPGTPRLRKPRAASTVLHWDTWSGEDGPLHAVMLADAVRHCVRCQAPRAAIATLDSILHHRLMTMPQLHDVIAGLPSRFQALLPLVDASAESGPETFVRLMLRAIGVTFETQVRIPGVGRVDFVVDGWLIIECDSKEFHEGWEKQTRDRARDIAAARLGYVTVRPLASDIMHQASTVRDDIAGILSTLGPKLQPHQRRLPRRPRS